MKKTETQIKILGIYQIAGGVLGLLFTFIFFSKLFFGNKSVLTIILSSILLFSFSVYCGFLLLTKKYDKGLNLSIINQIIQVISFSVLGYTFEFCSGIFLKFGLDLTSDTLLTYNFGLTTWNLKLNSDPSLTKISINILALMLINLIFNIKEKIIQQNKLAKSTV